MKRTAGADVPAVCFLRETLKMGRGLFDAYQISKKISRQITRNKNSYRAESGLDYVKIKYHNKFASLIIKNRRRFFLYPK